MRELRDELDQWALDLPGFGESPPAGGHTVREYVADVVAFIESLGQPVHLVANSLGGMICVYVASSRPDLVESLSLISPAMPQYRAPLAAQTTAVMAVPWLGEQIMIRAGALPSERTAEQLAALMFADFTLVPTEELEFAAAERARWASLPHANLVLLSALRSIVVQYLQPSRRSAWHAAQRILCPTLVMTAGHDSLVGSRGRARWQRTLPKARLVYLPNSGHVAMMEHPRAVADVVRDFLADASSM